MRKYVHFGIQKRNVSRVSRGIGRYLSGFLAVASITVIAVIATPYSYATFDNDEQSQSQLVKTQSEAIDPSQSTEQDSQSSTDLHMEAPEESPAQVGVNNSTEANDPTISASPSTSAHGTARSCIEEVSLNQHFGPTPGAPYRYPYVGNRSSQNKPITFNADGLYATTLADSGLFGPVTEISNSSGDVPSIQGLFGSSYTGNSPAINNLNSAVNGSWAGSYLTDLTTMALDGGKDGTRTTTGYFWSWNQARGNFIGTSPGAVSNWPNQTNSIPVAVFPNGSDASANGQPDDIIFIPLPYETTFPGQIVAYNYWSGGEVDQQTGRIYFTGGEDTSFGNTTYPARFMIFDPVTGDYAASGNVLPKTPEDKELFGSATNYLASDLVIDGLGDMYVLVHGVRTPIPNSTSFTYTKWLVKIEAQAGENGEWLYSGVMPLWFNTGTDTNPIYTGVHSSPETVETWGSAFYNGKLYFAAGLHLYETDPLTGWTKQISGTASNYPYDLAAADPVAVLNGTVYNDANRNGIMDNDEEGIPGQLIQIYDDNGKLVGQQETNSSGEYSFLMPTEATYHVRLVQPQINADNEASPIPVNATQTGIDVPTACSEDEVSASSFGEDHQLQVGPFVRDGNPGSYIDPPAIGANETFDLSSAPLVAQFILAAESSVTTVNFGANAEGSWGDAGNNANSFDTTAADGGPRHVNPGNWSGNGGNNYDNPSTYLGSTPGWYKNGVTDGSHEATDDGIHLVLGEDEVLLSEKVVLVAGEKYTFHAEVNGARASEATVRTWLSQPGQNSFGSTFTSRTGSGEFELTIPSGNWSTPSPAWLRSNATSSTNAINNRWWNTENSATKYYAPEFGSELSKTADWVIDGETEDYPVTIANGALRISISGAPGDYSFTNFTNVVNDSTIEGTLPTGESSVLLDTSMAVLSTSTQLTFRIDSIPIGSAISSTVFSLFDKDGNELGQKATYNADTQTVTVPSTAFTHAPDLRINIATDTPSKVSGIKVVSPIAHLAGAVTVPSADQWEVTATDPDSNVSVISEETPLELVSGTTYTIGERLKPTAPSEAAAYTQQSISCTLDDDGPLPSGVFDEANATITTTEANLSIICSITNAAAQVTLYDSPSMVLSGSGEASGSFSIANENSTVIAPGFYSLSGTTSPDSPQVGLEYLDLETEGCQDAWDNRPSTSIPSSCWLEVSDPENMDVRAAINNVFRINTISSSDLPALPNAGGIGSYVYVILSVLLIGGAATFYFMRQKQQR